MTHDWSDEAVAAFMDAALLPPIGKFNTPRLNVPKGMSAAMLVDGGKVFIQQLEVFLAQVGQMLDQEDLMFTVTEVKDGKTEYLTLDGSGLLRFLFSEHEPHIHEDADHV